MYTKERKQILQRTGTPAIHEERRCCRSKFTGRRRYPAAAAAAAPLSCWSICSRECWIWRRIAVSAASLAFSSAIRGHATLQLSDFSTAFLIVAAVALLAPAVSARMKPDAGDELSGHHTGPAPQRPPPL